MGIKAIKDRNGEIIPFDSEKITLAIQKACIATNEEDTTIPKIVTEKVVELLSKRLENSFEERIINVEEIQDAVEKELMAIWKFELAKDYILYREKRSEERKEKAEKTLKKIEKNTFKITKSNGKKETFDVSKIEKTYNRIVNWLKEDCPFSELEQNFSKYIIEDIKTEDITKVIIKSALDSISVENTWWQFIAGRFATLDLYKKASKNREREVNELYSPESYLDLFKKYIKEGLYYKDFMKYYTEEDILEAGKHINENRDYDYNYTTILMLNKRYLLNPNGVINELPQEMYMSAALYLAIKEKPEDRLKVAIEMYEECSNQRISLPTPTLMNARTNYQQLSSCFKLNISDDLRSIYHGVENMAQISKYGWWIWVYLGHIRSKWGSIRWIYGASWWVNPWIKVINDTALAVNQLWARAWAISVTLDIWHRDIFDFLELQTESWDIRSKAFDIFPAVSIPDLFMKRVKEDWEWTLFDPKEIRSIYGTAIEDTYGEEFEEFYKKAENNPEFRLSKKVPAKDLFKKFLKTTVETGMPYVFYRDTVNKANPNKHAGMVYCTQLCTEICQNTSETKFIEETIEDGKVRIEYQPWDTVTCNLASINVAKVNTPEVMEKTTKIISKIIDNVIDLNFYTFKESEITALKYRSVWIGYLWVAEYLATNLMAYDSEVAREHCDKLFERFTYYVYKASNELSKERWAYSLFEGSDMSKWIIIWKDKEWFAKNSKNKDLDWESLIDEIIKTWTRFSYHLAPAPNTSTAWVVWTTAAMLPIYKKYFVETNSVAPSVIVAPNLNKENFWYYKEYVNMDLNDVIDMVSIFYKWIDQSISFEWIINPQQVSPAQLYGYYFKAWEQEIKTVYYVRSMSLDVKECISCSG